MMLVPTLCDLADQAAFRDKIKAYQDEQVRQDRQNETEETDDSRFLRVFRRALLGPRYHRSMGHQ